MALTPKRLFLYLCISISLLRPYTLFSRSPLVNKTLFERHGLPFFHRGYHDALTLARSRSFAIFSVRIIGSAEALPILCVRYIRWERERYREREREREREIDGSDVIIVALAQRTMCSFGRHNICTTDPKVRDTTGHGPWTSPLPDFY